MAKVEMTCPRCSKNATEYDQNKWQCLQCGAKFLYDPDAPEKAPNPNAVDWNMIATLAFMVSLAIVLMFFAYQESRMSADNKLKLEMAKIHSQSTNTNSTIGVEK